MYRFFKHISFLVILGLSVSCSEDMEASIKLSTDKYFYRYKAGAFLSIMKTYFENTIGYYTENSSINCGIVRFDYIPITIPYYV